MRLSRTLTLFLGVFPAALFQTAAEAQDGSSCTSAVLVEEGIYTAPADDYWYRFVPTESQVYHLTTCDLDNCDTKIWVYDHCLGLVVDEGGLNAIAYNDDNCNSLQTQVDPYLEAGETYYIRIGDYQDACAGNPVTWQLYHTPLPPPPSCGSGQMLVQLSIVPDGYPNEISWEITDGGGLLLNSGNYIGAAFCVDTATCLLLTMHDGYGDGIIAPGGYWLYVDSVLIDSGGDYTTMDQVEFNCPPGFSCHTAFTASEGWQTAPASDTWYSFTPDTTGFYTITTCDSNNCDTRIWVYDLCDGLVVSDNNEGTIYYGDDECGQQAHVNAMLAAGEEYWIRIGDSNNDCTGTIDWSVNYNGPVSGCMDPGACNFNPFASIDDGSCLQWGDPACPNAPDLMIVEEAIVGSISAETMPVSPNDCYITEGCLSGYGVRDIIRFTTHIKNIGDADYYIGDPTDNPDQFTWGNCHNHWHYKGYAEYIVYDTLGAQVVNGFKNGFCVLDLECSGGGNAQYGCSNMGITAGCGDIYGSGLDCQWVDMTGIPDGRYTLVVRCNWDNDPDALGRVESNMQNNWGQVCLQISHSPDFQAVVLPNCEPFVDCAGVEYGSALPDCEGICNGPNLFGDLDVSATQDYADADLYVDAILDESLNAATCNDLNSDESLTVTDVALIANCHFWDIAYENPDSNGTHDRCHFPKLEIINPYDSVTFRLGAFDFDAGWIEVEMRNPNKKTVGYELMMSGIEITGAESLIDQMIYPETPQFVMNGQHVLIVSYVDRMIPRSNSFVPVLRLHFANPGSLICISEVIDVVNENYANSTTFLQDACMLYTEVGTITSSGTAAAYPNPFSEQTTIQFDTRGQQAATVVIEDALGRVVRTYSGVRNGRLKVERGNLAPGSYTFRVTGATEAQGRLVVE